MVPLAAKVPRSNVSPLVKIMPEVDEPLVKMMPESVESELAFTGSKLWVLRGIADEVVLIANDIIVSF